MEPIITIEGYQVLQSQQQSRDLLISFYRNQGFEFTTPSATTQGEEDNHPIKTNKAEQKTSTANGK